MFRWKAKGSINCVDVLRMFMDHLELPERLKHGIIGGAVNATFGTRSLALLSSIDSWSNTQLRVSWTGPLNDDIMNAFFRNVFDESMCWKGAARVSWKVLDDVNGYHDLDDQLIKDPDMQLGRPLLREGLRVAVLQEVLGRV